MKKYNKSIQITVQVDSIAQMLLGQINEAFPNREGLTEAIIGTALNAAAGISPLYNALCGFTNDLDGLVVGMEVNCNNTTYSNVTDGITIKSARHIIGACTIDEIDIYRGTENVNVTFDGIRSDGTPCQETQWVNHESLALPTS
jgi:hypothetical protein